MKTVVRTHLDFGENMIRDLENNIPEDKLVFWEDGYTNISRGQCFPFYRIRDLYLNGEIERVVLTPFYIAENVIEEVLAIGIPKDNIYVYEGMIEEKLVFTKLDEFTFLPYLEIHATDHCNLNCKGCSAFCPCVTEAVYADIDKFKSDIRRLKELIPTIRTIQIMGGEPTLNTNLDIFINEVKSVYPYCNLKLMTNGTLLDRIGDEVWEAIVKNDVTIDISCYPVVYGRMQEILDEIKKHGAKEPVLDQVSVFYPNLSDYKKYPFRNTDCCRCYNLRDGKISSCNMIMYGHYYNEFFNENLPFNSGIIDIYDEKLKGNELVKILNAPCDMCNYCSQYVWRINGKFAQERNWDFCKSGESPQKEDWY